MYIITKIITIIRLHPTWVAHKHGLSLNLSNLTIKSTTQQKQKPLIKSSGQKGCIRNKANQQPPWQNQSKVLLDKCQQLSPRKRKRHCSTSRSSSSSSSNDTARSSHEKEDLKNTKDLLLILLKPTQMLKLNCCYNKSKH